MHESDKVNVGKSWATVSEMSKEQAVYFAVIQSYGGKHD